MSAGVLRSPAWSEDRIEPETSNAALIFETFRADPDRRHGEVDVALLETPMTAVLGALVACLVGLPLAFLAARNRTPSMTACAASSMCCAGWTRRSGR